MNIHVKRFLKGALYFGIFSIAISRLAVNSPSYGNYHRRR